MTSQCSVSPPGREDLLDPSLLEFLPPHQDHIQRLSATLSALLRECQLRPLIGVGIPLTLGGGGGGGGGWCYTCNHRHTLRKGVGQKTSIYGKISAPLVPMPMPLAQQNVSAIISWHWSHTLAPVVETPAGPGKKQQPSSMTSLKGRQRDGKRRSCHNQLHQDHDQLCQQETDPLLHPPSFILQN